MSRFNKVVWTEGMFLRPHHFQQQDRYVDSLVRRSASTLRPHAWGLQELGIDRDLLATGKFAVTRARGFLPDGTLFDIPEDADPPPPLELGEGIENAVVYLALPIQASQETDADGQDGANGMTRYAIRESRVADSSGRGDDPVQIHVGRLRLKLMLQDEDRAGYQCVGLGRIVQVGADKGVLVDDDYIVPAVDCRASPALAGFINEIEGLLRQRGESLAGKVSESGRGGAAEIADFLLLQVVNRYEPLIAHLAKLAELHPEALYRVLLELSGELATFTRPEKRAEAFPIYRHDALQESFAPVMASLRRSLSMVLERNVVSIPLEERNYGIRVATINDRGLLTNASFVLSANASMPAESLRQAIPAQVKAGPVERIRDLVNLALPGIGLNPLPVAPRQLPYHAGASYFELDTQGDFWKQLDQSGGLAFHVSGEFPELEMALWAIKQ